MGESSSIVPTKWTSPLSVDEGECMDVSECSSILPSELTNLLPSPSVYEGGVIVYMTIVPLPASVFISSRDGTDMGIPSSITSKRNKSVLQTTGDC